MKHKFKVLPLKNNGLISIQYIKHEPNNVFSERSCTKYVKNLWQILQMLQRSLDISVGRAPNSRDGQPTMPIMDRHISAAGTRFRLLACGMSLLQVTSVFLCIVYVDKCRECCYRRWLRSLLTKSEKVPTLNYKTSQLPLYPYFGQ